MQHHKKLKDLHLGDLFVDGGEDGEEDGDTNMSINLLTVAGTGNAAFLNELLKAGLDPDVGDSQGKTPLVCLCLCLCLYFFIIEMYSHCICDAYASCTNNYQHIAASKGHEDCIVVLLKHACSLHLRGKNDSYAI